MTVKTTVCFSRTIVWQFKNNNNLSVHKNYPCFFFENKNIHAIQHKKTSVKDVFINNISKFANDKSLKRNYITKEKDCTTHNGKR